MLLRYLTLRSCVTRCVTKHAQLKHLDPSSYGLPLWRGRLGVGCWIQHETLVGCMATSIYKGETDLLVTRYTLDTSCFSGPLSASSWSATTKLGQALRSMSRLSSARRLSSRAAGRLLALAHNSRSGGGWDPGGVCTRGVHCAYFADNFNDDGLRGSTTGYELPP